MKNQAQKNGAKKRAKNAATYKQTGLNPTDAQVVKWNRLHGWLILAFIIATLLLAGAIQWR